MENMHGKCNLNPLNFVMLALFSWECALEITIIELEFLTDVNMIIDSENGVRRNNKSYVPICRSK